MSKAKAIEVIQFELDNQKLIVTAYEKWIASIKEGQPSEKTEAEVQQMLFKAKIKLKDCEDALDWVQRKSAFN